MGTLIATAEPMKTARAFHTATLLTTGPLAGEVLLTGGLAADVRHTGVGVRGLEVSLQGFFQDLLVERQLRNSFLQPAVFLSRSLSRRACSSFSHHTHFASGNNFVPRCPGRDTPHRPAGLALVPLRPP